MIDINQLREVVAAGIAASEDFAVIPAGYKLEDLERFKYQPNYMRGTFRTSSLSEFASYVGREAVADQTRIFVNPETMQAIARIDHGSEALPGWGKHIAVLTCVHTPAYTALLELAGRGYIKTGALVDWLLDWRNTFSLASGDCFDTEFKTIPFPAAIQALRKIKINTQGEFSHEESDASRTRTAMEKAAIVSDPPSTLALAGMLYEGLGPRELFARLVYRPADEPTVCVKIMNHENIKAAMAVEFRANVEEECEDLTVHIGTFTS